MLSPECDRIEYKERLIDDLEKEVVAFLNSKEGGSIYIGIRKDGKVTGIENCDELQLKIKDRLIHNICPNILGLIDITCEKIEEKNVLQLAISVGSSKPYYIKSKGMSESGCYVRVGSSAQPMDQSSIDVLYTNRTHTSLMLMKAPRQDLTFNQLRIYYEEHGKSLNENFAKTLEFLTPNGEYNYVAYLCSDNNTLSVLFGKYDTIDRIHLIENLECGNCCILRVADRILEKLKVENKIFTRVTSGYRIEVPMYDIDVVKEAVTNALIHTNYFYENPPKFELFPDRLEITSMGRLPDGLSKEEFFIGVSYPRNRELMRIFKDMNLVDHFGHGVRKILQKYSKDSFVFLDNFIRVSFPLEKEETAEALARKQHEEDLKKATVIEMETREEKNEITREEKNVKDAKDNENSFKNLNQEIHKKTREKTREEILDLIKNNPTITTEEIASILGITPKGVEWHLTHLKKIDQIRRVGPKKGGYWKVIKK